jgi:hypothetical protein
VALPRSGMPFLKTWHEICFSVWSVRFNKDRYMVFEYRKNAVSTSAEPTKQQLTENPVIVDLD